MPSVPNTLELDLVKVQVLHDLRLSSVYLDSASDGWHSSVDDPIMFSGPLCWKNDMRRISKVPRQPFRSITVDAHTANCHDSLSRILPGLHIR